MTINIIKNILSSAFILGAGILLSACGGGGGGSSNTGSVQGGSASSSEYAKEVVEVVTFGGYEIIFLEGVEDFFYRDVNMPIEPENETNITPGECGGTETVNTIVTSTNNSFPYESNITTTFDDFCFLIGNDEFVENGVIVETMMQTDEDNGLYVYEVDSTYTSTLSGQETYSVSALEACDLVDGDTTCSLELSVQGGSGINYTLNTYELSGDEMTGYDVTIGFADGSGGSYTVVLTDLVECFSGGGFFGSGSGTITTPNNGRIDIEFLNCNEYMVTYQGVSETYNYD